MYRDFTIIFDKMTEHACAEGAGQVSVEAVMLSRDSFGEMDELAELRRVVAEITEPEALSFTTT